MIVSFNSDTEELRATSRDMQTYIDSCKKERAAYTEHNNLHLKDIVNITVDSDIITPHKKKMGERKISRSIVIFLSSKRRKIKV